MLGETPDLYDGATFPSIEDGVAHASDIGLDTVIERGAAQPTVSCSSTRGRGTCSPTRSSPDHDGEAAELLLERVTAFVARLAPDDAAGR